MQEIAPQRSLREKQRQEREDLILQATQEVLLEKGYHETSMDEIAARVGIAKGTLYLHFARKEDIILTLLKHELQTALETIEQTETMTGTSRDKLTFILNTLYERLFSKNAQFLYMVFNSSELNSVIKEKSLPHIAQLSQRITDLLEEGKQAGEFDSAIPTDIMLNTFYTILSPKGYRRLIYEKNMSSEELIGHIRKIFFRGIAADPSAT